MFSALLKCLSHGNRNRTRLRGNLIVITARKRSLGQGNVFTPVCHSVHNCGGWLPTMHHRSHDRGSAFGGTLFDCRYPAIIEIELPFNLFHFRHQRLKKHA